MTNHDDRENFETFTLGENSDNISDVTTLKPKKELSRQGRMYRDRRSKGLCTGCGGKPVEGATQCKKCQKKERTKKRKSLGCKPRKQNGRGRPAMS